MASLVERLQKLQIQAPEELPDLSQYSLEQLESMKIEFGTKHLGKQFKEVWSSDQQWIAWFLKHYQASKKGVHRTFVHYVTLKIERAEMEGSVIPVKEAQPQLSKDISKAPGKPAVMHLTPKAKSRPMEVPVPEDLTAWDLGEMEAEEIAMIPAGDPHLELRMQNLENALQSIVMHLEHMAAQPPQLSRADATEQ